MSRDEFFESLLPATYEIDGVSIPLNILSTSDDFGRTLAFHARPHQNGARARDMGGVPRSTRVTLVFLPPNVIAQALHLKEAFQKGKVGLFVHPLFGAYQARVEQYEVDGDGQTRDFLSATAVFFEDIEDAENALRVDLADFADAAACEAAIEDLRTELDAAGLESTAPDAAAAQVEAWDAAESTNRRSLALELAAISNQLQEETDRLELATDVANYPVIVAFGNLHNNLRNFAGRLMSTAPRLTTYTVRVRQPLMAILQDLYGARGALDRVDRILALNDLANPAAIDPGTVLTVEVR